MFTRLTLALAVAASLTLADTQPAAADDSYAYPVFTTDQRASCAGGVEIRSVMTTYIVTLPLSGLSLQVPPPLLGNWQTSRPLNPSESHDLNCALPGRLARTRARLHDALREIRLLRSTIAHDETGPATREG